MFLEDDLKKYDFHCVAKGYTSETTINKRQEYKQLLLYLKTKRSVQKLKISIQTTCEHIYDISNREVYSYSQLSQ